MVPEMPVPVLHPRLSQRHEKSSLPRPETRYLVKLNLINPQSLASLLLSVLPNFQCVMYGTNVQVTMTT
jgi:hypothetical protein